MPVDELRTAVDELMGQAKDDLAELVSFKSVADPKQYPPDECRKAAAWVVDAFSEVGLQDVTASPTPDGRASTVRLTLILPDGPGGEPPNEHFAKDLIAASRSGMDQDCAIWDHIDLSAPQFKPEDKAAVGFQEFCRSFREA